MIQFANFKKAAIDFKVNIKSFNVLYLIIYVFYEKAYLNLYIK